MTQAVTIVRARTGHPCDNSIGPGRHRIRAGHLYRRTVLFPGSEVNTSDRPWTHRFCADCAAHNGTPIPGALTHAAARRDHTLLTQVAPGVWTGPTEHDRACPCATPDGVVAVLTAAPSDAPAPPASPYVLHVGELRYPVTTAGGLYTAMDIAREVLRRNHGVTVYWERDPHGDRSLARPDTELSPAARDLLDQVSAIRTS